MLREFHLLLATALLVATLPGSNAAAVDLIDINVELVPSTQPSAVLTLSYDGPPLDMSGGAGLLVACAPDAPEGGCDVSTADRCAGKKLRSAAPYCRQVLRAEKAKLRGASRKANRRIARATRRFQAKWNRAEAAAMRSGESCSENGQDFTAVTDAIKAASANYADLVSADVDTEARAGRSCGFRRLSRAAHLCGKLLAAEGRYFAKGSLNDPEMADLEASAVRARDVFETRWSLLPGQCGDADVGTAVSNSVTQLAETALHQVTSPDTDGDGISDSLDSDDDGDTWSDTDEAACDTDPLSPDSAPNDLDGDRTCDLVDSDDDGDGIDDIGDAFPSDPAETVDTDGDGTGNNADPDDDGDGWSDTDELACNTESLQGTSIPTDTDSDGLCDVVDADADGNGATDDVPDTWMTVDFPVGEVIEYDGMELSPICSKGTPWSLFARAGTVNKLLVYYQGGGACWEGLTCVLETFDTNVETDPEVGGSDHPARQSGGLANLEDPNNPFRDWHAVFVPYCTGDVHWGDTEVEYQFGATTATIHHKGAINAMAAESWIAEHFSGPEQVFVTGSSAGAYGAVTHSVRLQELFPDAQFDVVGDGGNGVVTQDFLVNYLSTWGIEKHLPEEVPELDVPLGELDMSGVYEAIARAYPNGRFATYTAAFDGGGGAQTFFYHIMKNAEDTAAWGAWWESSCEWNSMMRELNLATAAAVPNFRYYVGVGSAHTIWGRDKLYTDTTGGVPAFVDWIDTMLYGSDEEWGNVECTNCGMLLEGDDRPNPPAAPFVDTDGDGSADMIDCPGVS